MGRAKQVRELERRRRTMLALRDRGATDEQIAAALGVSRQRVRQILGPQPRAIARRLPAEDPPAPLSLAELLHGFD
jgi:DNA-directed RNA polymerase sigma subunit (sigma70/sigma32)